MWGSWRDCSVGVEPRALGRFWGTGVSVGSSRRVRPGLHPIQLLEEFCREPVLPRAFAKVFEIAREGALLGTGGQPEVDLGRVPFPADSAYPTRLPGIAGFEAIQKPPGLGGERPDHPPGLRARCRDQIGLARAVAGRLVENQSVGVEFPGAQGPGSGDSLAQAPTAEIGSVSKIEFAHLAIIAENL